MLLPQIMHVLILSIRKEGSIWILMLRLYNH